MPRTINMLIRGQQIMTKYLKRYRPAWVDRGKSNRRQKKKKEKGKGK